MVERIGISGRASGRNKIRATCSEAEVIPRPAVAPVLSPDLLALLAGCRAAPADDTPRLILADWLDENADSAGIPAAEALARAQLIRVQVELARPTFDTSRVLQLRAEEARLLRENAANWLGELGSRLWAERRRQAYGFAARLADANPAPPFNPLATSSGWRFDRGLLTLELTPGELSDPGFAAWFASPLAAWVETAAVDISGVEALVRIAVADEIRPYLGVRCTIGTPAQPSMRLAPPPAEVITANDMRRLTRCANFARVHSLTLHPAAIQAKILAVMSAADVSGLRRLTIRAPLTSTDASFVAATPLVNLSALDVSGCDLSDKAMWELVRSKHLRQLVSLVAFRNRFECAGLVALAESPLAGRLTVLELQNTGIGDRGVNALAESALLERVVGPGLNLSMNPIADAGAKALAKCRHLEPFTELILRDCRVGDAGAAALAESPNVANLTYLDLWKNRVSDIGAKALTASPYLGNVRELSLRDNAIGSTGEQALRARFGDRVKV